MKDQNFSYKCSVASKKHPIKGDFKCFCIQSVSCSFLGQVVSEKKMFTDYTDADADAQTEQVMTIAKRTAISHCAPQHLPLSVDLPKILTIK